MKRYLFLLTILIVFISENVAAQHSKVDCSLYFKKGKMIELKNGNFLLVLNGVLKNNSKDTLKYQSYSCSWQEIFNTNNKFIKIQKSDCDKNIPVVEKIPPKSQKTIQLKTLLSTDLKSIDFKIGIQLNLLPLYTIGEISDFRKFNKTVWSNKLTYKASR